MKIVCYNDDSFLAQFIENVKKNKQKQTKQNKKRKKNKKKKQKTKNKKPFRNQGQKYTLQASGCRCCLNNNDNERLKKRYGALSCLLMH